VRAATAPEAAAAVEVDSGATGGWEMDDIEDDLNVETIS